MAKFVVHMKLNSKKVGDRESYHVFHAVNLILDTN
jgi:hypothetical protein